MICSVLVTTSSEYWIPYLSKHTDVDTVEGIMELITL